MTAQLPDRKHRRRAATPVALPVPAPDPEGEGLLDLAGLMNALWRHKLWLLSAAALGGACALAWALFVAVPTYQATTLLMREEADITQISLEGMVPGLTGGDTAVNTEVEVLRSRPLLAEVVTELGLLDSPEFNPTLRPPGLLQRLRAALMSLRAAPPAMDPQVRAALTLTATIDDLNDHISVRNIPDSMVFEVVAESPDRVEAAAIANALARAYIRRQLSLKFSAAETATLWMADRVAELESDLQAAERRANAFAAQANVISPDTLEALTLQLADVRQRIAARSASDTPRSRAQLPPLLAEEAMLAEKILKQSTDQVTLEQLMREAAASRLVYESFLGRLKEAQLQQGIQQADSTILSHAEIAEAPARPRPILVAVLGMILGLGLAGGIVLRREAGRANFRAAEELETATGKTVLGQVPLLSERRRRGMLGYLAAKPGSAPAEAVRNLRTSLLGQGRRPPRVIMVTSSAPGEGKTTQTLLLAQSIGQMGKRVLVIEADIRRRSFADYINMPKDAPGLADVIAQIGDTDVSVLQPEGLPFDVLPCGTTRAAAGDLFAQAGFGALIRTARKSYDIVLIDTPPVLVVPDARAIGPYADAVLYVVQWDQTDHRSVTQGLRALATVGVDVSGLVLTQVHPRRQKSYGVAPNFSGHGYYQR